MLDVISMVDNAAEVLIVWDDKWKPLKSLKLIMHWNCTVVFYEFPS